jgi:hypothetical protein
MLCAWDLGLRTSARPYRPPMGLTERPGRRWEVITGWADDEEDEEEEDTLDGDVLGEVSGARRRRTSRPDDPFPYEKTWEVELDDSEDLPVSSCTLFRFILLTFVPGHRVSPSCSSSF